MSTAVEQDPFTDMEIPAALHDSMERHRENLARLVGSLRSVGLSEAQIDASVSVMVDSYKQELLRAIKALVRS